LEPAADVTDEAAAYAEKTDAQPGRLFSIEESALILRINK
jgi:hypothetical protein